MVNRRRSKHQVTSIITKSNKSWSEQFWIFLGVIFVFSAITLLSYVNDSDDSSVTGHATIQNIAFIKGGQALHLGIRDIPGVNKVIILVKENIKGDRIIVYENKNIKFVGDAISKFTISSQEESKYGDLQFLLKVADDELSQRNLAVSDLKLYANGKELSLTPTEKSEGYQFYTVTASEMGEFVIGREVQGIAEESSVESPARTEPAVEESKTENVDGVKDIKDPHNTAAPLAGKAAEQEQEGLPTKIADFFRSFFGLS